jgi:hypothetical protein
VERGTARKGKVRAADGSASDPVGSFRYAITPREGLRDIVSGGRAAV